MKLLFILGGGVAVVVFINVLPDIRRYMRMRMM